MSTHEKCAATQAILLPVSDEFKITFSSHQSNTCTVFVTSMERKWRKAERCSTLYVTKQREEKWIKSFRVMWWTQFIIDKKSKHLIRAWIFGISWMIPKYWQIKCRNHTRRRCESVNNNGGKNHFNSVSSTAKMELRDGWCWWRWNWIAYAYK